RSGWRAIWPTTVACPRARDRRRLSRCRLCPRKPPQRWFYPSASARRRSRDRAVRPGGLARSRSAVGGGARGRGAIGHRAPLVSCIMPTHDRRPFVAQAIRYFHRQDYPNKELIVVDDGTDKVRDLAAAAPDVRYTELDERTSIGEKRNIAVAA